MEYILAGDFRFLILHQGFHKQIDDNGYIFDRANNCIAKIQESGYITKVAGGQCYGKIDPDGMIRNSMGTVIGRVQADGYVMIGSNRVCRVSSSFIERITPKAWNAGDYSSFSGRNSAVPAEEHYSSDSSGTHWPFGLGTTLKLLVGVIIAVMFIIEEGYKLGLGCVLAIPLCIALVFVVCFIFKLFI